MAEEKNKRVTIEDVAKSAGVSVSTVSRVMNNSASVSEEKRKKVLKQIKMLNFVPNAMARGLVQNDSRVICTVVPEMENIVYPQFLKGIESVAKNKDYSVLLYVAGKLTEPLDKNFYRIMERRARGIIMVATDIDPVVLASIGNNVEVVSIQTDIEGVCRVDSTNRKGTKEIIEYLIGLGHKKIAFAGYNYEMQCLKERLEGYKEAMRSHGLEIPEGYIVEGDEFSEPGNYCGKKLLELKDRPTAIHCMNERVAGGVYEVLMENDISVPDEISLTGFDDSLIARFITPKGLTTVAQPLFEMGVKAAEQVINNIESPNDACCEKIVLGTKLVIRGSATPPKE